MTIITAKLLEDYKTCPEGIKFFKRNFPEMLFLDGLDLSKIRVEGDHYGYFKYVSNLPALEYDERGRVIAKISFNKYYIIYNCIDYEYDEYDNMIKKTYSSGKWVTYEYDGNGNCVRESHSTGYFTTYEYDGNGNCVKIINSNGNVYQYEYDKNDNCIKEIDSSGRSYIFEYDRRGNAIKKIHPNGDRDLFEYDRRGNAIKKTFAHGSVISHVFEYGEYERLTRVDNCHITYLY